MLVVQRYLDGDLDDELAARVHAHLDDCVRCGVEAETYERIKASLAARRADTPPDVLVRLADFGDGLAPSPGS